MIVHSLSGPSGTGKSTSAIQFAHEHGIEAIIDDGILVVNGEKKQVLLQNLKKTQSPQFVVQFFMMRNIEMKWLKQFKNMIFNLY